MKRFLKLFSTKNQRSIFIIFTKFEMQLNSVISVEMVVEIVVYRQRGVTLRHQIFHSTMETTWNVFT